MSQPLDLDAIRERLDAAQADGEYGYGVEARALCRALVAEVEQHREVMAGLLISIADRKALLNFEDCDWSNVCNAQMLLAAVSHTEETPT
jgi:hypothetical protein